MGIDCQLIDLVKMDLPLYSPKSQSELGIPQIILDTVESFKTIKSFIAVAPEYNGSLPPTLNNLLAWMSVSTKDWREAFNGKACLLATHSGSGGLHALMAMRQQFSYIGSNVLGRQIHTHYKKELNEESAKASLELLKKLAV